MTDEARTGQGPRLTRREALLGGVGLVAGGGLGSGITLAVTEDERGAADAQPEGAPRAGAGPTLEVFSVAEASAIGAVLARLIPSDETGPGAFEAQVIQYLDRGLAGPLRESRGIYQAGLAQLDAVARAREDESFAELEPEQQDEILRTFEAGEVEELGGTTPEGGLPVTTTFFETVREHALQGMFGDPVYGGNAEFVGWELLGYPGSKYAFSEEEQELGTEVDLALQSAYGQGNIGPATEADNGG